MQERTKTLIKWINITFNSTKYDNIDDIVALRNVDLLEQILLEIDDKFFGSLQLAPGNELDSTRHLNLGIIYRAISRFYNEVIGIEFETDFFNPKLETTENFRKLAELITGMSAQCDKRGVYLQEMQNMENEDSTELFTILTERISAYTEDMKIDEFKKNEDESEDETTGLYIRIENLEIENSKLQEEVSGLNEKIGSLTKDNFTLELSLKEAESKYQELLDSFENKHLAESKSDYEESVNISIQLSELRGKLEARDKNMQKLKEEKERLADEYRNKFSALQKENEIYREKSIKYDVLKEKMHQLDELNSLKAKLIQGERIIKEQEEKIKKLKNYDVDKNILLKKIEELNIEISNEKEKFFEMVKECNHYKDMVIQNESEMKFLRKQVENLKNSPEETFKPERDSSLCQLEEVDDKRLILELETKLKFINQEKSNLITSNTELTESIKSLKSEIESFKEDKSLFEKKSKKWTHYKEERNSLFTKVYDLTEKLHEIKTENEALKFSKIRELSEQESNHKNAMNDLNFKHNEEIFSYKEAISKLDNENNHMKKEIKKTEDLIESNKLYIEELNRKIQHPGSDNKLIEIESKLKELVTAENIELKRKVNEKEENITKLNERIKSYDLKIKEYAGEIEKLKKISEEISIEELKKNEDAVNYYKSQLETKEKLFNEEQQLMASLFHQLALEYSIMQSKSNEPPFNFSIDKL